MPKPTRAGRIYGKPFAASLRDAESGKAATREEITRAVAEFEKSGGQVSRCDAKHAHGIPTRQTQGMWKR